MLSGVGHWPRSARIPGTGVRIRRRRASVKAIRLQPIVACKSDVGSSRRT